jgi:hypothetical protein
MARWQIFCSHRVASAGGNPAVQVNNYDLSHLAVAKAANTVGTTAVPANIYDLSH